MSKEAVEACKLMLEKNRNKRPNLEECMNLAWFAEFKAANQRSKDDKDQDGSEKFKKYALTNPDSPRIQEEIKQVESLQEK